MKPAAFVRGGSLSGVLVAMLLTSAGRLLDIGLPPFTWSALTPGLLGRTAEWARTFGMLLPFGVLFSLVIACCCAFLFEFVTARASALAGAVVGVAAGLLTAAAAGLVPWIAFWFTYAYMATSAPLGPYNAAWIWLVLLAAGALAGVTAGATYGPIRRVPRAPRAFAGRETWKAPLETRQRSI